MSQLVPLGPFLLDTDEDCYVTMYSSEWAKDDKKMFVTFDGLNSGVPTRTTPTLTPTTLRTIEQTLIDFQCETERESHQNEAGFVPPIVQPISQGSYMSLIDSKSWQGGTATVAPQSRPSVVTSTSTIPTATTTTTRKNTGGRRPARHISMSPEEEERRRVRRERNKMAAARCRKRRVDHTNALLIETEGLEQKKQGLQQEIQQLQLQKEELEFVLEAHKACCRLKDNSNPPSPPDIKPFALLPEVELKENAKSAPVFCEPPPAKRPLISGAKPPRPNTLPVATAFTPSRGNPIKPQVSLADVAGLSGNTPVGNFPLNFESLMEGGTGLTPVSGPMIPSCSSQQRNSGGMDLSSPDSVPPKLVSL